MVIGGVNIPKYTYRIYDGNTQYFKKGGNIYISTLILRIYNYP